MKKWSIILGVMAVFLFFVNIMWRYIMMVLANYFAVGLFVAAVILVPLAIVAIFKSVKGMLK